MWYWMESRNNAKSSNSQHSCWNFFRICKSERKQHSACPIIWHLLYANISCTLHIHLFTLAFFCPSLHFKSIQSKNAMESLHCWIVFIVVARKPQAHPHKCNSNTVNNGRSPFVCLHIFNWFHWFRQMQCFSFPFNSSSNSKSVFKMLCARHNARTIVVVVVAFSQVFRWEIRLVCIMRLRMLFCFFFVWVCVSITVCSIWLSETFMRSSNIFLEVTKSFLVPV